MEASQLDLLFSQLKTIFEHTYFENEGSRHKIQDFVNHIVSSENHCNYLREQLKNYYSMSYHDKLKLLRHLVGAMFADREVEVDDFKIKTFTDLLSNKIVLIFALFNYFIEP